MYFYEDFNCWIKKCIKKWISGFNKFLFWSFFAKNGYDFRGHRCFLAVPADGVRGEKRKNISIAHSSSWSPSFCSIIFYLSSSMLIQGRHSTWLWKRLKDKAQHLTLDLQTSPIVRSSRTRTFVSFLSLARSQQIINWNGETLRVLYYYQSPIFCTTCFTSHLKIHNDVLSFFINRLQFTKSHIFFPFHFFLFKKSHFCCNFATIKSSEAIINKQFNVLIMITIHFRAHYILEHKFICDFGATCKCSEISQIVFRFHSV